MVTGHLHTQQLCKKVNINKQNQSWASGMAQQVKELSVKSDNLSSILRPHMLEGENQFLEAAL